MRNLRIHERAARRRSTGSAARNGAERLERSSGGSERRKILQFNGATELDDAVRAALLQESNSDALGGVVDGR